MISQSMQVIRYIIQTAWAEASMVARVVYVIGITLPGLLTVIAGQTGWPWVDHLLPRWGWFLVALLIALCGLLLAVAKRAHRLDEERVPKLEVRFEPDQEACVHETYFGDDTDDRAIYVAVLPRAVGTPIKSCVGYLTKIWERGQNGKWVETTFNIRRQLQWGGTDEPRVTIDSASVQPLNIFFVKLRDQRIHLTPYRPGILNKDRHLFGLRDRKQYKFDILVASDDGPTASVSLQAQLGDEWNDVQVSKA